MPALRTRDTRSLEVTTETPQAPALAIVSPTPRAFTFPSTHNLADSPYSSPSSSPFEPDLLPVAARTQSPLQLAPPPSTSPRPLTHQRRKSSVCSITTDDEQQRRPRKGDSDYIKRPENAFILFRRKCCEDRQAVEDSKQDGPAKRQRQADLSKTISQQWKSLTPEERKVWEDKAKERKKEHEALYPNYVYRPQRTKDKAKAAAAKKSSALFKGLTTDGSHAAEVDTDHDPADSTGSVSIVIPMGTSRHHHGRSASVPTPPPYQSIVLPNLYSGVTSSCRTSPSLLPMITRRASMNHHHHLDDGMVNSFDFLPNDHFMPPPPPISNTYADQTPTAASTGFEAIQSSEFLRDIFSMPNIPNANNIYPQPALHLNTDNHLSASPASSIGSSSGPSSPSAGPFTPLSTLPHPPQPSLTSYAPDVSTLEYPAELFQPQDLSSYPWDTTSIWPTGVPSFEGDGSSQLLLGDDFDISAIPPIELGSCNENGKFGNELDDQTTTGSALQFGQDFTNALGFDEMMAGHPRY